MFTIMYENKFGKQFCEDFCFESISDVKSYLNRKGYVENNRVYNFEKGWSKTKAYIQPLKKFKSV